jgi:hypothetical protein
VLLWSNKPGKGIKYPGTKNCSTSLNDLKKVNIHHKLKKTMASKNKDSGHKEGPVAKAIESQTAKIPSDAFLWTAVGAMSASIALKIVGNKHDSLFVGQWAAPFLLLGVYNKLVKHKKED